MGFSPAAPSSPGRDPRDDRQLVLVFVPAENLRRVCVVPLELMAGVLLLVRLALRSRCGSLLPVGDEQPRMSVSDEVSEQPEHISGSVQHVSSEASPELQDINQQQQQHCLVLAQQSSSADSSGSKDVGQQWERSSAPAHRSSPTDSSDLRDVSQQSKDNFALTQQDSSAGSRADNAAGSDSSATIVGEEQERREGPLKVIQVAENNQLNEDHANVCVTAEPEEEEASREYGPMWPCSAHPPNQSLRFCDLTEEEQEEIMDADLEAYRKAWQPGDMKYILWNPDPNVADEDQGQEAFHDENYEFFWWTPTAYRTTTEKHVYVAGNVTRYPVHGQIYCSTCDRYVWEALPKRGSRPGPAEQSVPVMSDSQRDSYQTEPATEAPPRVTQGYTPTQCHCLPLSSELQSSPAAPTLGVNYFQGSLQRPLNSALNSDLLQPEGVALEMRQHWECLCRMDKGDPEEVLRCWTHLVPRQPVPACDLAGKFERLCITAKTQSSEFLGMGGVDQGRSVDVDCLERRLMELLEQPGDVDIIVAIDRQNQTIHEDQNESERIRKSASLGSETVQPAMPVSHKQSIQESTQDRISETQNVTPDGLVANTEQCQESRLSKQAGREGSSKRRRNRRARKLSQMKRNSLEPRPGPSGRCRCKCEPCLGCTGLLHPESSKKVQAECKAKESEVIGTAPSLSFKVSDGTEKGNKDSVGSEVQRGRTRPGEEFHQCSHPENVNKTNDKMDEPASSSSDPKSHFIDISFGECEPIRIYRQSQTQTALQDRPFYEPLDKIMTPEMDVVLGAGCMDRLIASGLNMDDFIIREGSGRNAKTMFLWPGAPTTPCIDLVGQRSHRTSSRVLTFPLTVPEVQYTGSDRQKSSLINNGDRGSGKLPRRDGAQLAAIENHGNNSSQPGSAISGGNVEGNTERPIQGGKLSQAEGSAIAVLPSAVPSPVYTSDAEPVSSHSSEDGRKAGSKTKRRFRFTLNKIWKKRKELSTDPSSPFSTFGSGSPSSDEGTEQRKMQSSRTQDLFTVTTGQATVARNVVTNQKMPGAITSQRSPPTSKNMCARHHAADFGHGSAEDELLSKAMKIKTRRHIKEVRRARRTVQHLRLVRRSHLHTTKATRTRKLAQQLGIKRGLWRKAVRLTRANNRQYSEAVAVPTDVVLEASVNSFRHQLSSEFGPARQSHCLSRPTVSVGDPHTHHAEVAVNNRNINDVYKAVTRLAEGASAREVEVELCPKDSPVPALRNPHKAASNGETGSMVDAGGQLDPAPKEATRDLPLSPYSKADGMWNGGRPEDSPGVRSCSKELGMQETVQATTDQAEAVRQVDGLNPHIFGPGDLSHNVSDEIDFVRDFEESELGKLISLTAKLEKLDKEASVTESHTEETSGMEIADNGVSDRPVSEDQGSSSKIGTLSDQPPQRDLRNLDALTWDPSWLSSPPLSPRSRLWTILSQLPRGQRPPQSRHASPSELLPGSSEDSSADEDPPAEEQASDFTTLPAPQTAGGAGRLLERLDLRPEVLIMSAHLQPEDSLLAHGDPARPWVRCHSRDKVKTLADLIAYHRFRPVVSINAAMRKPVNIFSRASFTT